MHTFEQLSRGDLAGIKRLDLQAGLDHFPDDIFGLADSLEVLNLSDNKLSTLPHDLSRLSKLRVIFCSGNPFTVLPESLGDCANLEMVGFKSCQVRHVPEAALPQALRWFILTDNAVDSLPNTLGERPRLQKLMLAGNRLSQLPAGMANAHNLQLLRIAANRFEQLPPWLLSLPRLAWLAYAGNPLSDTSEEHARAAHPASAIPRAHVSLGQVLGQGASGVIHRADWQAPGGATRAMAAKMFKGAVTSDGLPRSEMAACLAAGRHANLVEVAGPLTSAEEQPEALLFELIDPRYRALAGPPSLESCTRDTYPANYGLSTHQVLKIAAGAASVTAHLHRNGILHGDLYGHNLLVDSDGHTLLSDFGAASFFAPGSVTGERLQRIESLAFGFLLEELIGHARDAEASALDTLRTLRDACLQSDAAARPTLIQMDALLNGTALPE